MKRQNNSGLQRARRYYFSFAAACILLACPAFAASDPLAIIDNLSDFVFSAIRAIGVILLGWGVVQIGLSLQSHDPSQRSNGFLTFFGGVMIALAKEILTLLGVS